MLSQTKALKGCALDGLDREIGEVRDFYFDDVQWVIRYLVADTGTWLKGRQILLSPHAVAAVVLGEHNIAIGLTQRQIEDSPPLISGTPVSRPFEEAYYQHYGWPAYWVGPHLWGPYPDLGSGPLPWHEVPRGSDTVGVHLRNTADLRACQIRASGNEIGHFEDFVIDDETWAIRFLIVDTKEWWPGKKVLVSPRWIESVDWNELKILVHLPSEVPEYHSSLHYTHPSARG